MIGTFSVVRAFRELYILFPEDQNAEAIRSRYQPGSSCLRLTFPEDPLYPNNALVEIDSEFLVPYSFAYLKPKNQEGINEGSKDTERST